jgi:uncharacterized peroxidase-related enzyme
VVGDPGWVAGFQEDYRSVELSSADRAMLDYSAELSRSPPKAGRERIERLRAEGFSDRAILDINQITGFFAWCNRTIEGLGVELEPGLRGDSEDEPSPG